MMKVTYKTRDGKKKTHIAISQVEFFYNDVFGYTYVKYKYKNDGVFENQIYARDLVSIEEV